MSTMTSARVMARTYPTPPRVSSAGVALRAAAHRLEPHGGEDQEAGEQLVVGGIDVEQPEAVGHEAKEEHADDGAPDRALTAAQVRASDRDRGDHREHEPGAAGSGVGL